MELLLNVAPILMGLPPNMVFGSGVKCGKGSKIVRRFDTKKNIKKLKKEGMKFDSNKGQGIPTTSTDIQPVNPDKIRKMTGARSADAYIDIDITGKKAISTKTKAGHVEIRVQESISPDDIVSGSGGRVKKSIFNE